MSYYDSETISIPTVLGNRKEAGLYVYIPPPPTPFAGEWIGLATKQPEIITAINLSKQSLFLYAGKENLVSMAEIKHFNTMLDLSKESMLLEKQITSTFCDSKQIIFSFTIIGGMNA